MMRERIDPLRETLATERQKWEKRARIGQWAFVGLAGVLIALSILRWRSGEPLDALTMFSAIAVFAAFAARRAILNYGLSTFKSMIVPHVLEQFGTFTYQPKPDRTIYRQISTSHLLPSHNRSSSEDHIEGRYRDLPVAMVEAHLKQKRDKNETTKFKGLVLRIENPRVLHGSYGLFPQFARLGGLFGYPNGWDRIKLESDAFENKFDFVGTDQIEGRVLFTPVQMEQWVSFVNSDHARAITAIFAHRHVYLAISRKGDWMDDGLINNADDDLDEQVRALAEDLAMIFEALDILVFGGSKQK